MKSGEHDAENVKANQGKQQPKRSVTWSDMRGLKRLWPYVSGQKPRLFLAIALIPLIAALNMVTPMLLKWGVDAGVLASDYQVLVYAAGAYLTAIVLSYVVQAVQTLSSSQVVYLMIRDLRIELIRHVLKLSPSFHNRNLSGVLSTRSTSDFNSLSESLNQGILNSIVELAVLAASLAGMFWLDWRLALVVCCVLPAVVFIVLSFARMLKSTMLQARIKLAALNGYTQESLKGVLTVKLLGAADQVFARFHEKNVAYRDAQMKSVVLDASLYSIVEGIASLTLGLVLYFAVAPLGLESGLSAGLLVAFVQYIQQVYDPLKSLTNKMAVLQGAFTAMDRVFGLLGTRDFIAGERPVPKDLKGRVEVRNVSFAYRSQGDDDSAVQKVLSDVSFSIEPGRSMAIVGSTGSGKSTLVKLVAKLYGGYSGDIDIDGHSLAEFEEVEWRQRIALVPQDIALFHGSVAFNVSLDQLDVTREDIEKACRLVSAWEFVEALPGGLDFVIEEGGQNLSHGQRQLIVFARAMVRQPALVILDEATAAVDRESEQVIQQALDKLFQHRTVIVIAHRLETIRRCDHILVLEGGRVVEYGTDQQLIERGGRYFQLLSTQ